MIVDVLDWKKEISIRCSLREASRIVCISYRQMQRWKNDFKIKKFNNYTVFFNTQTIKQPKRCHIKNPFKMTKEHI